MQDPVLISGRIHRIRYHKTSEYSKAGEKFLIAELSVDGNIHIVKGNMLECVYGADYKFYGDWAEEARGPCFKFFAFEPVVEPGLAGQVAFLNRFISGIGKARAKLVAEHFGDDCLSTLRADPSRINEVDIPESVKNSFIEYFENNKLIDPIAYSRLVDLFSGHKIERRLIDSLLRDHGSSAPDFVLTYPYRLLSYRRIGFKTVDQIAIEKCKYDPKGIDRHIEGIREALTQISDRGHTYALRVDVEIEFHRLVGCSPTQAAIDYAVESREIYSFKDESGRYECWALNEHYEYERQIAEDVLRLSGRDPLPFDLGDETFNTNQICAAELIRDNRLFILTGSAGTGKTYVTTNILKKCMENGLSAMAFVAPTGKAAKRGHELASRVMDCTGIPFSTIHQILEPIPTSDAPGASEEEARVNRGALMFRFGCNRENPILYQLLVIDEGSMCDIEIFAKLLAAVPDDCRVLIVGDPHQLPSVGPGAVLRNLIEAGIPSIELTEVRRNSGAIVYACHSIKDGITPEPCEELDLAEGKNWAHIECDDPEDILDQICHIVNTSTKFDKIWGMQVISAQKMRLKFGCEEINKRLSVLLNPSSAQDPQSESRGFAINDKVIRTKNGFVECINPLLSPDSHIVGYFHDEKLNARIPLEKKMIVNGDMGIVRELVKNKGKMYYLVDFVLPDRACLVPAGEPHLIRAYAITVHKSQGSGFPCVVCPIHKSFYWDSKTNTGLFNRELAYTMLSRAELCLVTVGQQSAISLAIDRKTVNARKTRLTRLLTDGKNLREKTRETGEFSVA